MENDVILEAVLFASGEPVSLDRLCTITGMSRSAAGYAAETLAERLAGRGVKLVRMDDKYQLVSNPECAAFVRVALEERKPAPLTNASMETLAIIAYNQPTTRAYVDLVRGMDSSNSVNTLIARELIEESGRLDTPGRPSLFVTTPTFLRVFGLESLDGLPELSDEEPNAQFSFGAGEI